MKEKETILYKGVDYGDWVDCVNCGSRMLLPCGADVCPQCGREGTMMWVDEEQEKSIDGLDNVSRVDIELHDCDYMSTDLIERRFPEKFGLLEE